MTLTTSAPSSRTTSCCSAASIDCMPGRRLPRRSTRRSCSRGVEVERQRQLAPHDALVVVHSIVLDRSSSPATAGGGMLRCLTPWAISDDDLAPISFLKHRHLTLRSILRRAGPAGAAPRGALGPAWPLHRCDDAQPDLRASARQPPTSPRRARSRRAGTSQFGGSRRESPGPKHSVCRYLLPE